MGSYNVDTKWYVDIGATDHVTSDLEKLAIWDKYKGGEQIHTTCGVGMGISHVGHSVIPAHTQNFYLKNILHVLVGRARRDQELEGKRRHTI